MASASLDASRGVGSAEDQDDECISTEQLIEKLEEAWLNEKFSPEILPYLGDVVDCLVDQLTHMQENLQQIDKGDFRVTIHRIELDRIQYILTSYMKIRLRKIEKHGAFILNRLRSSRSDQELLSPEELRYARAYIGSFEDYFRDVALVHMPPNLQSFSMSSTDSGPDLDEYVFLKVKREVLGILVDEGTADHRNCVLQSPAQLEQVLNRAGAKSANFNRLSSHP
uniref:GINS complex subunit 4 n=1 Tax=Ixodes ricinus TaxID=34613 RepID=A0A0K8RMB8_IXORI